MSSVMVTNGLTRGEVLAVLSVESLIHLCVDNRLSDGAESFSFFSETAAARCRQQEYGSVQGSR